MCFKNTKKGRKDMKRYLKVSICLLLITLMIPTFCFAATYRTLSFNASNTDYAVSRSFNSQGSISISYRVYSDSAQTGTFELQTYVSGSWITLESADVRLKYPSAVGTLIYSSSYMGTFRVKFTSTYPITSLSGTKIGYFN